MTALVYVCQWAGLGVLAGLGLVLAVGLLGSLRRRRSRERSGRASR